MVAPVIPFTIKGVIWYQGENNVSRPLQYERLFSTLINSWRKEWRLGDFPFYYVQITPFYWIIAPWYRRLRVITGGDYFQDRFNSKLLTGLYVGFGFLFLMFHIAVALTAIGKTVAIVTVKPETELSVIEKGHVEAYREYRELRSSGSQLGSDDQRRLHELEIKADKREIRPYYSYLSPRHSIPFIILFAISMSINQILRSKSIICSVPGPHKAEAVKNCLENDVLNEYPASILQDHKHCHLYLDRDSASSLSGEFIKLNSKSDSN